MMENQPLVFLYIPSYELKTTPVIEGQLIFTTDTKELYFDDNTITRNNITAAAIIMKDEATIRKVSTILINRLYIAADTNKILRDKSGTWDYVIYSDDILDVISDLSEYEIGIMTKDSKLIAPNTLASQVYLSDGSKLITAVDETRLLTCVKTKAVYVQATTNGQKIFSIPFPKENYDFLNGDSMTIIRDSNVIDSTRYEINNGKLIFDKTVVPFSTGETFLFVFYYRMIYNLNDPVVLGTDNIADGSITSPKISQFFRLDADKVIESVSRLFFTPEEKEKLKGIDYYATCYHHPDTHPASMIVESITRMFVSQTEKDKWNSKADSTNTYTKAQVDQLVHNLIDSAPGTMDTLNEIAKALNDDPDFAATMTKELAKKATVNQFNTLNTNLNTRVAMTDYIRAPIYGAPSRTTSTDGDLYSLPVDDPNLLEYIDGMTVILKIGAENSGKTKFRINSLATVPILTQDQFELIQGELKQGSIYTLKYNGTTKNFILQGKGGVKLRDALESSFTIKNGESIERGDLIDLVQNSSIVKSVPRTKILSRVITEQDKFNCTGKIKVFKLNYKTFLAVWLYNTSLRMQIIYTDETFTQITATTDQYTEISADCVTFEGCNITDGKVMLAYSSSGNMLTAVLLESQDNRVINLNKYTRQETQYISNINVIPISNDKCILGWQSKEDTRTMYLNVTTNAINIISSRSNLDYPLNVSCKISDEQILFASSENNVIRIWTMAVSDNDFFNSTVNTLYQDSDTTQVFNNLSINQITDTRAILNWTDSGLAKYFTTGITVAYDGGITKNTESSEVLSSYQIKNKLYQKQLRLNNGYLLSISNYDIDAPSLVGGLGNDLIKACVCRPNSTDKLDVVDKLTDIPYTSTNISFTMLSDSKLIIAFNCKKTPTDIMRLCFVVAEVRKMPYGVSLAKGTGGQTVKIEKW